MDKKKEKELDKGDSLKETEERVEGKNRNEKENRTE